MKKQLTLFMLALVCSSASATCYYADPASTDSKANGTSWEQAVTISNLRKAFSKFKAGDTIYVKGGTIQLAAVTERWDISSGVTIIGGFDPAATGTVTALPQYPSLTPTILDGDINKDGKPSSGDAPALIRLNLENNLKETATIQGLDLINTYYDIQEEATQDLKTYMADAAALRIICGTAYIKNCHIYNHITPINRGSQCVTVVGAQAHLVDCELHDCISLSRGALVRLRSYFIGGAESYPIMPSVVLERCCLYNGYNMGITTDSITQGIYGGAVHVSTGDIFAINSTFVNNSTYSGGGAIRASEGSTVGVISCTFGNNVSLRPNYDATRPNTYGSAFCLQYNCTFKFANTFIGDDKDNATRKYTPFYSDSNDKNIEEIGTSGGYNIFGTIYYVTNSVRQDDLSAFYQSTDKYSVSGAVQNFSTYFGSLSRLTNNGGCSKSILPLQMQNGDNVAHLQALADAWCPSWTKVDASVDQRGVKRNANVTCVGAAAYEGTAGPLYTISTSVNNTAYGSVTGAGTYEQGRVVYLTATPKNGYFFSHWSDGNTDNPRAVTVTKDAAFVAYFTNSYMNATILSDNSNLGYVIGGGQVAPHAQVSIGALCTKEGYRFSHWSDGSTIPGRTIEVTRDTTLIAYFIEDRAAKCYDVSSNDPTKGKVDIQIIATPAEGNSFMCWLDGNTDNPRVVTNAPGSYMAVFMGSSSLTPVRVVDEDGTIKIIRDGQLYILRDGKTYNAQGTEVR